jgi:hypothetical protein
MGSAIISLALCVRAYQNGNTRNPSNVIYNIAANIGALAGFTDATLFGGEPGFANTSAYGSETTTLATP